MKKSIREDLQGTAANCSRAWLRRMVVVSIIICITPVAPFFLAFSLIQHTYQVSIQFFRELKSMW